MSQEKETKLVKNEAGTKEVVAKRAPRPKKVEESANGEKQQDRRPRRNNQSRDRRPKVESEYTEKLIDVARVTKVVKGGRRFSFSAFVVIGNKKGSVGYGHGKANEVPDAIKKAVKDAKNNLVNVPLNEKTGTIPHETNAKFLSSKVMLKPAPKGKGLIASGTVRAVVELAGYSDIVTKTYGSRSKANIVKATVKALQALRTPEQIAEIRDKDVKDLK
ncbi:30S ribosomal protein S5 [Mycoplasmopsis edwardii]|uniref:30S ribosomal protein S5 n=2 Tax=Mycoplasmopsis edwardii TaxID=53558 RepID=A0ACD4PHW7_9BACT|nr:30S ribosomal protein S5 [Mycoplasmopsis edwardii]SYV96924.1 30S ribosomal protein S5 [Mycoplasmopsis edwardii]